MQGKGQGVARFAARLRQIQADLIVEENSSTLVTAQQLPIAVGNDKISPSLFRFLPCTPSIVCGAWELLHCHQGQRASFHNQIFPNQVTNLARCFSMLSERKNTVYPQLQRKMVSTLRVISRHSHAKMYQALPPEQEAVGQDHINHIKCN